MRQGKPKVVVYFGKEKNSTDPFGGFGAKRKVYYELFDCGSKIGLEMYVSSGRPAYKGGLFFGNLLKFEKGKFIECQGVIEADAVYDRSGGLAFPSDEISDKVLNSASFKKLCADKNATHETLGNLMPKSIKIQSTAVLEKELAKFPSDKMAVLKPASDFGGKGIFIDYPEKLKKVTIERDYVLQEFVDTSKGIKGLVDGLHDLRVVIVEGNIVFAHVRTPKEGSLLANVAQGGGIFEIGLEMIPEYVMNSVRKVQDIIDDKYNKPLYSVDFGISNDRAYVFELNDQIGFPNENMHSRKKFICNIAKSLKRLAAK